GVEAVAARGPLADMIAAVPRGGADLARSDDVERADILIGRRQPRFDDAPLAGPRRLVRRRRVARGCSGDAFGVLGMPLVGRFGGEKQANPSQLVAPLSTQTRMKCRMRTKVRHRASVVMAYSLLGRFAK